MDFNDYQKKAERTIKVGLSKNVQVTEGCLGLAGESGEVCDLLKKHLHHNHNLDLHDLKKELGDVLWYVSEIASAYTISLNEIAELNIQKLESRYPNGFSSEYSINRKE